MSDQQHGNHTTPQTLPTPSLSPEELDTLGQKLVWRIGRDDLTDEVVVRVGYASATGQFAARSRLRSVSDNELEEAMSHGEIRVEWVD